MKLVSCYVVFSENYMGMDGTYTSAEGVYATSLDARLRVMRLSRSCTHEQSQYDSMSYYYEEVPFVGGWHEAED